MGASSSGIASDLDAETAGATSICLAVGNGQLELTSVRSLADGVDVSVPIVEVTGRLI